ncbi:MAG: hypothetical protein NZM37_12650 [Sandaracinaceae bacterium]|nr:hypothetical protein [Sandaracinaceae bacterium]
MPSFKKECKNPHPQPIIQALFFSLANFSLVLTEVGGLFAQLGGCTCEAQPGRHPARFETHHIEELKGSPSPLAQPDEDLSIEGLDQEPEHPKQGSKTKETPDAKNALPSSFLAARDSAYEGEGIIPARRYVYRVRLILPASLGEAKELVPLSTELVIDASADRARIRLDGPGWPLETPCEIRLRADLPGLQLKSPSGKSFFPPRSFAEWFDGAKPKGSPPLSIRRDPNAPHQSQGDLICAFLAEWAGEDRDAVARRCGGKVPFAFRLGPWRGECTAELPLFLPKQELRADFAPSFTPPPSPPGMTFLEPSALARIGHSNPSNSMELQNATDVLIVQNESDSKVILVVEGTPVAWVAAHSRLTLKGIPQGWYRVGLLRPLGDAMGFPRPVHIPSRLHVRNHPSPLLASRYLLRESPLE